MRLRALFLLAALPAAAAIFPERIATTTRGAVTPLKAPDPELYAEFGFQEAEQAVFTSPTGTFTVAGWKVHDSTAALALYFVRRPADAKPADLAKLSVRTPDGAMFAYGNFVFEYTGHYPTRDEVDGLLIQLKQVERSPLPTLINYMPKEGLIPNSERYILGPVSLARFSPAISPSQAAFHLSAEGEAARYRTPKGEVALTVLNYPTPNMARERQDAFLKLSMIAKRSGPLVAVVIPPADPDAAETVLAKVQYEAGLTRQAIGTPPAQGLANLVLTGFLLSGVIIAASLLAGLWLGGFGALLRKFGLYKQKDAVTVLRIGHTPSEQADANKP
ncbi:MAG: DUF6599 family protein [Acidobacteriota bacterium]